MPKSLRSVAESRFAALTRREDAAMTALEEEQQAVREKTARLRAQRLAAEAKAIEDQARALKSRRKAKPAPPQKPA